MHDPTPNRPLWRVMHDAYATMLDGPPVTEGICYAAELRAIADWLVPEEPEPDCCDRAISLRWIERQRLRLALLAEADRAEAGDG